MAHLNKPAIHYERPNAMMSDKASQHEVAGLACVAAIVKKHLDRNLLVSNETD